MEKRLMPMARQDLPHLDVQWELTPQALERWSSDIVATAAAKEDPATISIMDPIGADFFGEGMTAKRVSAILRNIGAERDVIVNVNSPGGDLFEGIAIYNVLREHQGKVT
jgi:ATP-dependent Clp protease protease subunit